MIAPGGPNDIRRIPIEQIDAPDVVMREVMADPGLDGLAESLHKHGQLQTIGVVIVGDRYRVAYGHRRRIAAERAGLAYLDARVFPEGTPDEQAIKVDENEEQEAVNAAAQATYYRYLLEERCTGDVDRLVRLVRRRPSFVLDRLDLTRGDPEVLDALRTNDITLGVAQELNKVSEDLYRRLYLHDARRLGLSIKAVRELRITRDRERHITDAAHDGTAPRIDPSTQVAIVHMDACTLCSSTRDQHEMTYVKVHRSCLNVWHRDQAETKGGAA